MGQRATQNVCHRHSEYKRYGFESHLEPFFPGKVDLSRKFISLYNTMCVPFTVFQDTMNNTVIFQCTDLKT